MFNKILRTLSQVAEKYRLVLWILLILLTTAILIFPVHLNLESHTIQSTYIFGDNLPFFGVLFCLWIFLLLVLILSRQDVKWEKIALVCIFAIVFLGFWTIITPYFRHSDEWYRAAHIQYIQDYGAIDVFHPDLEYFTFPGLPILGSAICQVTGLSIFAMRTVLVLFLAMLFSVLLFLLFLRYLKNPAVAAIGVILFLLANIIVCKSNLLFSSTLAYIFIVSFLILETRHANTFFRTRQDMVLLIVFILATTITHFVSSSALFFFLVGMYLMQKKDRGIGTFAPSVVLIAFSLVIFLSWQMYVASPIFTNLVAPLEDIFTGGFTLSGLFLGAGVAVGATGGGVPLWALATKLFWWVFVYAAGSILWIKSLFRIRNMSNLERKFAGGLTGLVILAIVATLAGAQGYQGAIRYLMYAPLFTIPLILLFLTNLGDYNLKRFSIGLLATILFCLSLPTFFVNNDMIEVNSVYPSEIASREFMVSNYGGGEDLTLASTVFSVPLNMYYLPKAAHMHEPGYFYLEHKDDLWMWFNQMVDMISIPSERIKHGTREHAVFIYSRRLIVQQEHVLGFEPTHHEWSILENRLSSAGNEIYNNGDHLYLFERT